MNRLFYAQIVENFREIWNVWKEEHPTTHFSKSGKIALKLLFKYGQQQNNCFNLFYKKVFTFSKPTKLFLPC